VQVLWLCIYLYVLKVFVSPRLLMNGKRLNVVSVSGVFFVSRWQQSKVSFIDDALVSHYLLKRDNFPAVWSDSVPKNTQGGESGGRER
jgi:hypothetical protein